MCSEQDACVSGDVYLYVEVFVMSGIHLGVCSGPSGHSVAMESSR